MKLFLFLLALLTTTLLTSASLLKLDFEAAPKLLFKHSDKILHFTAYFVLATSWFFAFMHKMNLKNKLLISFLVLGYGVLMEILQGTLTNHRQSDFLDFVANALGVLVAFFSFRMFKDVFVKVFG